MKGGAGERQTPTPPWGWAAEGRHRAQACTYLCSFIVIKLNTWVGFDTGLLACLGVGLTVHFPSFHFSFDHLKNKAIHRPCHFLFHINCLAITAKIICIKSLYIFTHGYFYSFPKLLSLPTCCPLSVINSPVFKSASRLHLWPP